MSITVFVKTEGGVHDVEVAGDETVGSLYKKAASAAGLLEGMFKLVWEGKVLSMFGDEEVQGSELVEGAVIHVVAGTMVGLADLKGSSVMKLQLERLVAADPELVLEVDVGDTPDKVVCIVKEDLPSGLRGLVVTDSTNRFRDIGDNFLRGGTLVSLDLKLKLNTIGSHFLYMSSLSHIDFGDQTNVTSIGSNFLSGSSRLQSLDLTGGFTNVTLIGSYFLASTGLQDLDLRSFTNVTAIGECFLAGCKGLQNLELGGFNVAAIDNDFLSWCSGLQNLDLRSFTNVTSIGESFLDGCSGLQKLDLRSFTNVVSIGDSFLSWCSGLQNVDLQSFTNVASIGGEDFLFGCTELQKIEVPSLPESHALKVVLQRRASTLVLKSN